MKITVDRAKSALMEYISDEFCNRLYDYRKWLVPVFIGSYMPKLDKLIEEMRAQRESSEKQIDRLLTIIETITNTSK